ncbi:uncharacterized protein LOC105846173 isoform X2 [Hydra vulgaris]|uniref:uncharacterized protein LOC105846173 isoform X2 n=1 Tax=Hydra vulgaris TaxID=6087 RepID=UPI0032EA23F6
MEEQLGMAMLCVKYVQVVAKFPQQKKVYIIGRGIQKMTKEKIEEIASSYLLKSMFSGLSQKNKELNNDIHRVAMNENEQMKMGSMLTGFMKLGLVSEAEKLFQQWKSNIKSEKVTPKSQKSMSVKRLGAQKKTAMHT